MVFKLFRVYFSPQQELPLIVLCLLFTTLYIACSIQNLSSPNESCSIYQHPTSADVHTKNRAVRQAQNCRYKERRASSREYSPTQACTPFRI
jgi:hypothetical protein